MKNVIGYTRVSTTEQGISRNGLEAQRAEIERWASSNNYNLIDIVEEIASGSLGLSDRPVLATALRFASKMKAQIVVSKLDRLSRNAGLCRSLMRETKQAIAINVGEQADSFVSHIYAGLAEKEREMIGERTRAGLAAAKARGVVLGNRTNLAEAQLKGAAVVKEKANAFAARIKAPIERMKKAGMTMQQMADELNEQGMKTARNGKWQASTVCGIIKRYNSL